MAPELFVRAFIVGDAEQGLIGLARYLRHTEVLTFAQMTKLLE
jgi:hypothetical protein